jgi:superoxide reductase
MAEVDEVYKCELCGNVVKVMEGGAGTLVCCGQDMVLQ